MQKKSLYYRVEVAHIDDLKKRDRQIARDAKKIIAPWDWEKWYPSLIIEQSSTSEPVDLGWLKATSHAYVHGKRFKNLRYQINEVYM